jgi:excisionase family DNA binding protein
MSVIVTRAAQEEIDRLRELLASANPHLNYTVEQACEALSVKESTLYKLIHAGELCGSKVGRMRYIPYHSLIAYKIRCAERGGAVSKRGMAA